MRRLFLFCFLFLSTVFSFSNVPAVQASTTTDNPWQTAPLPPPTATSAAAETVIVRLDQPFTLGMRQWAMVSDTPEPFRVQLAALVSDSRCPAGVNCVVAGQVEFTLLVRLGEGVSLRQFQIGSYPTNDQHKVRYAGYEIELIVVQPPAPPPDQQLQPNDYVATLMVRRESTITPEAIVTPMPPDDQETGQALTLNRPFSLHVGETANLDDGDFQVTVRSVTADSGCLTANDCSVMLAEGTLVLQRGSQREVLSFNVSFTPEQPFVYDFAGYAVELLSLKQGSDGKPLATFVVKKPTATVEIPAPERVARCPHFSRFDAAAILQEEVAQEAVANLVFGPIAPYMTAVEGLCGYVTTAFSDAQLLDEQAPYLASAVAADRAVLAAVVEGKDLEQLLHLAYLVTAADDDPNALVLLQTKVSIGFYDDLISDLTGAAAEIPAFTVTPIEGIGDEGVWLWRPLADGYFALLLIRDGERFWVVTALLNGDAEEGRVMDYAMVLARGMD